MEHNYLFRTDDEAFSIKIVVDGFGHGEKNQEGDNILEFTQAYDLALGNSFFKKREEHYVTYMSGTNRTVIDYFLVRRQYLRDLKDCNVIPGESIASQHQLLVASKEFKHNIRNYNERE